MSLRWVRFVDRARMTWALLLPLAACARSPQTAALPQMAQPATVAGPANATTTVPTAVAATAPTAVAATTTAPTAVAATTLPAGVPDSPAGRQLAWVMAAIEHPPSAADTTPHFVPEFFGHVPLPQVVALFAQLSPQLSPLTVDHVELEPKADSLTAVLRAGGATAKGQRFKFALRIESAAPYRMTGLLVRATIDAPPAASWDEVHSGLRAVAPEVSFLAAELTAGQCSAQSAIEPKRALALGSTFKLYVLAALARQIAAGKHGWDDLVTIDDALKSLPSGELQNEPAGKTFTVRQVAAKMISISDNTAADHLIAFVGRQAVEDEVRASGHAAAARMIPFLTTRELFALKLAVTADEAHAYVAADVAHKRKLLATFAARDVAQAAAADHGWDKPRMIDSLEYFASPDDLCKLMVRLARYAEQPATAPVKEILSINPGLPDQSGEYEYLGFKGGSEPGVVNLTWLLQRKRDHKWLFLSASFNDRNAPIQEDKVFVAATVARDFLGR